MSLEVRRQTSGDGSGKSRICGRKFFFTLILASTFLLLTNCSVPSLESEECRQARDTVKRFYSYHFASDMKTAAADLENRAEFLSADLKKNLEDRANSPTDYFTQTDDYPKAFRVGTCENISQERVNFGVLLFWKDDTRNEQRKMNVEAVNQGGKWAIDKVAPAAE